MWQLAIIPVITALIVLFYLIRPMRAIDDVGRWHSTEGKILELYAGGWRSNGRQRWWVKPHLRYQYTVNGKQFQCETVDVISHCGLSGADLTEFAQKHEEGGPIKVYYDPDQPEYAIVIKRENLPIRIYLALTLYTLVFVVPYIMYLISLVNP